MSLWSEIKQHGVVPAVVAEIKRRRMTQVVVAYLGGGWMVLVIIDQVVDREVLPLVVYEVALTVYLVGILAALIVGWYHGERGDQKAPLAEIVMLGIVGVVGLGASWRVIDSAMKEATLRDMMPEDLRRIGVLYFEDMSADGSMQVIADGITEGLISTLAQVRELDVRSRNGARQVRDLDVAPDSIARILDVVTLVDGTVDQAGDEIRVSVRMLDGVSGQPLFRDSYSWPAAEVASVGSELAAEVGDALREELGVELRLREGRAAAPNSAAWLQVARAERFLRDASVALQEGDDEVTVAAFEAADGELVAAQESAPDWAEPLVLRSQVTYEQWALAYTIEDFLATLAEAVEHADAALALEPDNAAALEWRGTALYRRWLLQAEEEETLDQVFDDARADLERSLRLDPSRASVNSTLSHLYYQVNEWAQAVLAARDAYNQDAFLAAADGVLRRLYQASYDLGDYEEARNWCLEGRRRFPENFRFAQCQLYVLTMDQATPDVAEAWALYAEFDALLPDGGQAPLLRGLAQTFLGGVVGRAGLPDSANAVLVRARVDPDLDPVGEQMSMEAAMRSVIGDVEGSVSVLERFMVQNPGHFPGEHWWWRNVQGNEGFERLQARR